MELTDQIKAEICQMNTECERRTLNVEDSNLQLTRGRQYICKKYGLAMDQLEKIIFDDAAKRAGWNQDHFRRIKNENKAQ